MKPRRLFTLREGNCPSIDDIVRLMEKHSAFDLALGSPSNDAPNVLRIAAIRALSGGFDQYGDSRGFRDLRYAIAEHIGERTGVTIDPETNITITCGATEGVAVTLAAIVRPGDEVIVIEPCYEQYGPMIRLLGARLRPVTLTAPRWELDIARLVEAFNKHTKTIILNNPHNPTGKVFTSEELQAVAHYCRCFDIVCIVDEVYDEFTFDNRPHVSMIAMDGMREQTVLIRSLSKTYQIPGWRIGFAIAPPDLSAAIRERHELFTGGPAMPLQAAASAAFRMPDSVYSQLRCDYQLRRNYLDGALSSLGFSHSTPAGAFYIFTDMSGVSDLDSQEFSRRMLEQAGVACVPGACFYSKPSDGRSHIRFCFAKSMTTLESASCALSRWLEIKSPMAPSVVKANLQSKEITV